MASPGSVGEIRLDLTVNQREFQRQMNGIGKLAKKIGGMLAAALATKALVDFGKECIELGSRLAEVDNVIQQTVPSMEKYIDNFAKNAIESFGMSETMAKQFTGVFASMARGFGYTEKSAAQMAITLSGLAADVASFYDSSHEEAFNKLKGVFTGETEGLKTLGIVMTQANLQSYALANGYTKKISAMSEAEKVALRYQFVLDQLRFAEGDFARTSDNWANAVRILNEQFNAFKATIGQGLINVFTPVLNVVNRLISRLMVLAKMFLKFTEMITGKKTDASGVGAVADMAGGAGEELAGAGEAADGLAASTAGAGKAAKKAAKDIGSAGIDELNIVKESDGGSGSGGKGAGGAGGAAPDIDFTYQMQGEEPPVLVKLDERLKGIIERVKELTGLFSAGFKIGLGDLSVIDSIKDSIESIGTGLRNIFMDSRVISASKKFADTVAFNLGKVAGSAVSVGLSIADNLLGGISIYLAENKDRLRFFLVDMFDIGADVSTIAGNLAVFIAEIFSILRGDTAKQITADIMTILSEAFLGTKELGARVGRDLLDAIITPFTANTDKIKKAIEDTLSAVAPVITAIKETVQEAFAKIKSVYDTNIHPMIVSFRDGFTEIGNKILDVYNEHILPVIVDWAAKFVEFKDNHLSPLIEKFGEFAGKVADCVKLIWEKALKPFILWFIENVAPVIGANLDIVKDAFWLVAEKVAEVMGNIFTALGGLIDFVTGVFTGDWEKAWEGIKTFFSGIWEAVKGIATLGIETAQNIISNIIEKIKEKWDEVWGAVRDKLSEIWENIKTAASEKMTEIKEGIAEALGTIKEKWDEIWGNLKETVGDIFEGIWKKIKEIVNKIIGGVEKMANGVVDGINKMIDALNNLSFDIPDWVPGLGGKSFGLNIPEMSRVSIPRLAQGGYVKKNTPQLAMIGDNRHQGEVVAPEDKLREMAADAARMAGGGGKDYTQQLNEVAGLLRNVVQAIEGLDFEVNLNGRTLLDEQKKTQARTGFSFGGGT